MSYDSQNSSTMSRSETLDRRSEKSKTEKFVKPSSDVKSHVIPESDDLKKAYDLLLNEDDNIWLES